jgi:hypothetical protein
MRIVTFERHRSGAQETRPGLGSMGAAALGFETLGAVRHGARRLGARLTEGAHADSVVDLNRALALKLAMDDVGAPEAEADSLLPADALHFVTHLPYALDAARTALEFALESLDRYDAPDLVAAGIVAPRRWIRLCAPVPRPGKIVGVARNYAAHGAELDDREAPEEPVLFLKAPSAVIGPEDEIVVPAAVSQADYEGELAVVIGRRARAPGATRGCRGRPRVCGGLLRGQRRQRAGFPGRARPALSREILRQLRSPRTGAGDAGRDPESAGSGHLHCALR